MVQVLVHTIAVDSNGQPVVILKPVGEEPGQGVLLPIWVGPLEATAILVALDVADAPSRPMPYDLMATLADAAGARVDRVEVTRLEEGTFYAEVTLTTAAGVRVLDARPSDSIALAVRVGAPMFVADDVLATAGLPASALGEGPDESELAAFQEFLDQVDPEDFRG